MKEKRKKERKKEKERRKKERHCDYQLPRVAIDGQYNVEVILT
jgi:hypothetical protein